MREGEEGKRGQQTESETESRREGENQSYNRHTQYLKTGNGEREEHTTEREKAEEILTRQKLEEEWNKRY